MQALQALLISLAFWLVSTAAENCSQQYIVSAKPPLLFGGVADASRCKANCQSRDTYWCDTHNNFEGFLTMMVALFVACNDVEVLKPAGRLVSLSYDSHPSAYMGLLFAGAVPAPSTVILVGVHVAQSKQRAVLVRIKPQQQLFSHSTAKPCPVDSPHKPTMILNALSLYFYCYPRVCC